MSGLAGVCFVAGGGLRDVLESNCSQPGLTPAMRRVHSLPIGASCDAVKAISGRLAVAAPIETKASNTAFSPLFEIEVEVAKAERKWAPCAAMSCSHATLEYRTSDAIRQCNADRSLRKHECLEQVLNLCRSKSDLEVQLQYKVRSLIMALAARGASLDVSICAAELSADNFRVMVARTGNKHKDSRTCLQSLSHSFLLCYGKSTDGHSSSKEAVIIDPRFREQFLIAHPSPKYEMVLKAVPTVFIGSSERLDTLVRLLCDQMSTAFKSQALPLPPWRTIKAMRSKWSITQLRQLDSFGVDQSPEAPKPYMEFGFDDSVRSVPSSEGDTVQPTGSQWASRTAPQETQGGKCKSQSLLAAALKKANMVQDGKIKALRTTYDEPYARFSTVRWGYGRQRNARGEPVHGAI